jgi:VWFA-related protein
MPVRVNSLSRRRFLLSAAALAPAARSMRAQEPQDTKFTTDVKVVNVFATVRDKQGKIVRDLTKDDFLLDEDGRSQVIRYFARESNLPLTLGLLIDTSGSQRRVLSEERTASYRFLDQVLTDKDQAFVIHFDREVELLQDLTSSRKKLEDALAQIDMPEQQRQRPQWGGGGRRYPGGGYPGGGRRSGGGGTSLYDSILLASDELMSKQNGRKALILLTDGVDNGSKVGISRAVEAAQRADTLVYGVRIADPEAYNGRSRRGGLGGRGGSPPYVYGDRIDGKKTLQRLSDPTGARYFDVSNKEPIDKIYNEIQDELRNQYSLGYTSDRTDAGPGYRRIHLAAKQTGLAVQAREGYYAHS